MGRVKQAGVYVAGTGIFVLIVLGGVGMVYHMGWWGAAIDLLIAAALIYSADEIADDGGKL